MQGMLYAFLDGDNKSSMPIEEQDWSEVCISECICWFAIWGYICFW